MFPNTAIDDGGSMAPWYALQVRPRHEKLVSTLLESKGVEQYLPLCAMKRRWSDRVAEVELPLFPGYVFCRIDWNRRVPQVVTTPGVLRVLGVGRTPMPVEEHELEAIRVVLKSGLSASPWAVPQVGETVRIEQGPLEGVEGVLVELKKGSRLVVSVSLLNRAVAVEVDAEWARPVARRWIPPQPALGCTSESARLE